MVKYLRLNPVINKFIRNLLLTSDKYLTYLISRWRLSGNIRLQVNGQSFLMYSRCDDGIIDPIFYNRSYIEYKDLIVFTSFIQDENVIFDIGSNTGIYSILSSITSEKSIIYSFEPNLVNLKRLERNISLNRLKNITVVPKAVGSDNTIISFTIPKAKIISDTSSAIENFSKSTYKGKLAWKNIEVEQVSIDEFCNDNNIHHVHMIKIDVEGYELNVLNGAATTIQKCKPILLLESFINEEKKKYLQDFVKKYEYYVYIILREGIIRIENDFNTKYGLNYLLLSYKTDKIFTSIKDIKTLHNKK